MQLDDLIPKQINGKQTDIEESHDFETEQQAQDFYELAKSRLLDISNWHSISKIEASAFCLIDQQNNPVDRLPMVDDFIRIDVPGLGNQAGQGFDWVRIEHLEEYIEEDQQEAIFIMRARPCKAPSTAEDETTHFFKSEATSNFVIRKKNLQVSGEVHGRNELANTESSHLIDKARNLAVATGSFLGFSFVQWNLLVKGIMS
ncbi:hypothetical protein [Pedobacter paludis]|uniref:Uncharacterized protein n=1 Tax=Pedobacter paludis TaxID=2203212 RepID=A0A317F8F3_9SPHI|nr:hypothetical protein [Pedobacter paludis]PWS33838.1 hypothetical protein DF947_04310 [Pedobacter paludis]